MLPALQSAVLEMRSEPWLNEDIWKVRVKRHNKSHVKPQAWQISRQIRAQTSLKRFPVAIFLVGKKTQKHNESVTFRMEDRVNFHCRLQQASRAKWHFSKLHLKAFKSYSVPCISIHPPTLCSFIPELKWSLLGFYVEEICRVYKIIYKCNVRKISTQVQRLSKDGLVWAKGKRAAKNKK